MKQQTAVEWLKGVIDSFGNKHELQMSWSTLDEIIEQAKEMEKEQKAENWQLGYDACEFYNDYDELQREPMKNPYRNKK